MTTATPSAQPALTGRRALVTGAASGIGAAVAARLAAAGAEVHLLDRDDEGVAKVAAQVHGTPHVVDLTDEAAISDLDRTSTSSSTTPASSTWPRSRSSTPSGSARSTR
jgi:3-hydroxybutyrate dehydrogenase